MIPSYCKHYEILKMVQPALSLKCILFLHLLSFFLSCPGISSCTLSTWLTCRLASSEQQRMFLEREHSLHHSHEMTEKVGEYGSNKAATCSCWILHVCMVYVKISSVFVCPPKRRSWTTPVTAFLRSPTTGTLQHHRDNASPQANPRKQRQRQWIACWQLQHIQSFLLHILQHTQ